MSSISQMFAASRQSPPPASAEESTPYPRLPLPLHLKYDVHGSYRHLQPNTPEAYIDADGYLCGSAYLDLAPNGDVLIDNGARSQQHLGPGDVLHFDGTTISVTRYEPHSRG